MNTKIYNKALEFINNMFVFLSIIAFIGSLGFFLYLIINFPDIGFFKSLLVTIFLWIAIIMFYSYVELIRIFIRIEKNTRRK